MKRVNQRKFLAELLSCGLVARLTAGLVVGMIVSAASVHAAQIDLANCQPKQVRICAYDDDIQSASGLKVVGKHILSEGESGHYTCHANCKFWISEPCADGKCKDCGALTYGAWLDHSWGKGDYQLVSLARTGGSDSNFKSSDLVKVEEEASCP